MNNTIDFLLKIYLGFIRFVIEKLIKDVNCLFTKEKQNFIMALAIAVSKLSIAL